MNYSDLPIVKLSIVLSSKEKELSSLDKRFLSFATSLRDRKEFPPQSIKHGLAANCWVYTVQQSHCLAVQYVFDALFECITPFQAALEEYSSAGWKVSFVLVIHMMCAETPEIVISSRSNQILARLRAELSMDIYAYEDDHIVNCN